VPPVAPSNKLILLPIQTVVEPEILPAAADGLTVIVEVAIDEPHALVTK
jgi:hypothetical protein